MLFLSLFVILFLPSIIPSTALAVSSDVIFNELAWMGTTASANNEWIELYNNTDLNIDISDWKIIANDNIPNIALSGIIPGHGFYLLERTDDQTIPEIAANQIYTGALENGGENLRLINKEGTLVDEIKAAEAWPAGNNSTKQTMERTDQGFWATSKEVHGTPKSKNSTYLFEKPTPANLNVLEDSLEKTKASQDNEKKEEIPLTALTANVFQKNIEEIKKDDFPFLKVFGLAILIAALSGIAVLMLKRLIGNINNF